MALKLCVIWWCKSNNICNNWYKTLCSSGEFINSRQCKTFEQLRYGFKRKIKWNKYQPIVSTEKQNLNCLIDLGVNRLVVLLFENVNDKK